MVMELLVPKTLIPKVRRSSYHPVFCYSSESGNSVKRLKSDPDPDDKNQGRWQLSLHSFLIRHMTTVKGWNALYLWMDAFIFKQAYLNLLYQTVLYQARFIPKNVSAALQSNNMLETSGTDKWPLCSRGVLTEPKPWSCHFYSQRDFSPCPPMSSFMVSPGLLPVRGQIPGSCRWLNWIAPRGLIEFPGVHSLWWLVLCDQIWHCLKWHSFKWRRVFLVLPLNPMRLWAKLNESFLKQGLHLFLFQ